ncbi:MlaD family protein [soil metagenome]
MQPNSPLAVRVGIFFTLAIVILIGFSLQVGREGFFKDTYEIVANFRQAGGVDPGTKVTLRGVPIGSVKVMDWDPKIYRVRVVLSVKDKYQIPKNAQAKIQVSSLLGGSVVNISVDQGPEDVAYLEEGDTIETIDTPGIDEVLSTISSLSKDTQNLITNLNKNQADTMAKINSVIDENRDYLKQTSESFASAGPKLDNLSTRLNEMTEHIKGGEGTIGRLYSDPELYDEIKGLSTKMNDIADQVKSGQGSLGSVIYDDKLTTDAKAIMDQMQKAAEQIEAAVSENREGFRNLVAALSDVSPKLQEAVNNFNDVSGKINNGTGTLGKLVNDPKLYEDAQRAINQVGESFESGEEQGVFRSFLGLIFGALI